MKHPVLTLLVVLFISSSIVAPPTPESPPERTDYKQYPMLRRGDLPFRTVTMPDGTEVEVINGRKLSKTTWDNLKSVGQDIGREYENWVKALEKLKKPYVWKKCEDEKSWVYDRNGGRYGKTITHWHPSQRKPQHETEQETKEGDTDTVQATTIDPVRFFLKASYHQTNPDQPGTFVSNFNQHAPSWPLYTAVEALKTDASISRWTALHAQHLLELERLEDHVGDDEETLATRKSTIAGKLKTFREQVKEKHFESQRKRFQDFNQRQQKALQAFLDAQEKASQQFTRELDSRENLFKNWRNTSRNAIDHLDPTALGNARALCKAVVSSISS